MTEAMPFLQKYDITFLRPPAISARGCFLLYPVRVITEDKIAIFFPAAVELRGCHISAGVALQRLRHPAHAAVTPCIVIVHGADAGRAGGHAAYDRRFLSAVRAEQHQHRGAKAAFDAVRVILAR